MHTYHYKVKGFDEVWVIVNSDWSGEATLCWRVNGVLKEVTMPGEILRRIAAEEGARIMTENVEKFLASLDGQPS